MTGLGSTLLALLRNPECPDYVVRDAVIEECGAVANVYVVYGETGEYSDHSSWTVAGFLDKQHAEAFRDRLNQWCKDNGADSGGLGSGRYNLKCPLDPGFSIDYTGTQYGIWEMPLRAEG